MKARVLTQEQADSLTDVAYNSTGSRFWVRTNEDDSLVITEDCIQLCEFQQHQWLKDCPLIDFTPKQVQLSM
jgi:hypothetical protein